MPYMFALLNIADWVITLALLNHGGFGEANPFAGWLMRESLWLASFLKIGASVYVGFIMLSARRIVGRQWGLWFNVGPVVIMFLVVAWNLSLVAKVI